MNRRLDELEEQVRILQEENERLAGRAEDTLLLSLIAEAIDPAVTPLQVLEHGLERISMLKDVPYAACCRLEGTVATIEASFFQYGENGHVGHLIDLPCSVAESLTTDTVYLTGTECEGIRLSVPDAADSFTAHSVLLIPVERLTGVAHTYVFADDRAEERLPSLSIMLHRAIDMIDSKIEILDLLNAQRQLNDKLRETNIALQKATQAKSDFLAAMSHEIRNPMNSILGFAQLLHRDSNMTDAQREQLDIIVRSGWQLLSLINEILEMSKIDAGRISLNTACVDLTHLLNELERGLPNREPNGDVALTFERSPDLAERVITDPAKLRQILVNLLDNALKFTEHGSVVLRASSERISATETILHFEVQDTGPGIAAEEMKILFTKFGQTSTGRASGGGTGLGLAISREFARLLGGDITVVSTLGSGTLFRVVIAVQEAPATEGEPGT